MKRLHLWLALALLIAVNAVVLAGVARNRSGNPDAELTLTERELVLQGGSSGEENTGLSLRLDWNRWSAGWEWFDRDKLAEIGFDVRLDENDGSQSYRRSRRALPKQAFVVLEYEGEAWQRHKEQKEKELAVLRQKREREEITKEQEEREWVRIEGDLRAGSRLYAVDVGGDPQQLRWSYPDRGRFIIVPALVRMDIRWQDKMQILHGTIDSLLVESLHLPRDLAAPILPLPSEGRLHLGRGYNEPGHVPMPRYLVQVRWGRRYEPTIKGVWLIEGE